MREAAAAGELQRASTRLAELRASPSLRAVVRALREVIAIEAPAPGLRDALHIAYGLGPCVARAGEATGAVVKVAKVMGADGAAERAAEAGPASVEEVVAARTAAPLIQLALFCELAEAEREAAEREVGGCEIGGREDGEEAAGPGQSRAVPLSSAGPQACGAECSVRVSSLNLEPVPAPASASSPSQTLARRFKFLRLAYDPAFSASDRELLRGAEVHVLPENTECLAYRTSLLRTLRSLGLRSLPTLQRSRLTLFLPHLPLYLTYNAMLGMRVGDCIVCGDVAAALAGIQRGGGSRQDQEASRRFGRLISRASTEDRGPWFVAPVWRYWPPAEDPRDCPGLGSALAGLALYVCGESLRLHGIISGTEPGEPPAAGRRAFY